MCQKRVCLLEASRSHLTLGPTLLRAAHWIGNKRTRTCYPIRYPALQKAVTQRRLGGKKVRIDLLDVVGVTGFEPATPASRTEWSTRLAWSEHYLAGRLQYRSDVGFGVRRHSPRREQSVTACPPPFPPSATHAISLHSRCSAFLLWAVACLRPRAASRSPSR